MNASDGLIDPKKYLKVKFSDLETYHRQKILDRAREYRRLHLEKIKALIKKGRSTHEEPPMGSYIFDPEKWDGSNWLWFLTYTMNKS